MEKLKDWLLSHKRQICCITAVAVLMMAGIIGAVEVNSGGNDAPHVVKAEQEEGEESITAKQGSEIKTDVVEEIKKVETDQSIKEGNGTDKKEAAKTVKKSVPKENGSNNGSNSAPETTAGTEASKVNTLAPEYASAPVQSPDAASSNGDDLDNGNNNTSEANTEQPKEREPIWHEPVYEDQWVVDQPAWDETISEPIYVTQEIAVGNQSGTIISGDPNEYLLNNSNGDTGWHSEVQQIQTGTNTYIVHHEEIGHYEQVLVQEGYWE